MKRLATTLVVVLILLSESSFGQTQEECKYFQVLTYLYSNPEIQAQIKKSSLGIVNRKVKIIEFNVSPWVEFIEVIEFKGRIEPEAAGIDKSYIDTAKLFYRNYHFKPYKSGLLDSVDNNKSALYLTFSKPIGNILLVELLNFNSEMFRGSKRGRGVKMLFLFSSSGGIIKVMYNAVLYN